MAWSELSTENLIWVANTQKNAFQMLVDMGEKAHKARGKDGPPSQGIEMIIGILTRVEEELRNRGFDPTDEEMFGPDVLGQIAEIKVELMMQGKRTL